MSIEAMKKAYDALLGAANCIEYQEIVEDIEREAKDLLKAIEQAEKQEPVAWVNLDIWKSGEFWPDDCFAPFECTGMTPLYNAPPQREWVGLTDQEILDLADEHLYNGGKARDFIYHAHDIEAKLKEKNYG